MKQKKLIFLLAILISSFSGILQPTNSADFIERTGQILQFDGTPFKAGEVKCGYEKEKFNPDGSFKILCPVNGPGLELWMGNTSPSSNNGCINTIKDAGYVNSIAFFNTSDIRHKLRDSEPIIVKLPKPMSVSVEVVDAQNNPVPVFGISGGVYHFVGLNGIVPKEPGVIPLGSQTPWRCGFMTSKDESRTFSIYPGTGSMRSDTSLTAVTTVNGKSYSKQLDLEFTNYPKLKFCLPFNFGPDLSLPADCSEKIRVNIPTPQKPPVTVLPTPTPTPTRSATPTRPPQATSSPMPSNLDKEYGAMYAEVCKIQNDFKALLNGFDYIRNQKYFEVHQDEYESLLRARDCIRNPARYGPSGPTQADFDSLRNLLEGDGKLIGLRLAWEKASEGVLNFGEKEKPVIKKKTITCLKGKSSLKVIGKNPVCPAGYRVKKSQ